jgi:hypothetical protein
VGTGDGRGENLVEESGLGREANTQELGNILYMLSLAID